MQSKERNQLRALQDKLLKHPELLKFEERNGRDFPVFGIGSPTINNLKDFLYPEYKARIKRFIN